MHCGNVKTFQKCLNELLWHFWDFLSLWFQKKLFGGIYPNLLIVLTFLKLHFLTKKYFTKNVFTQLKSALTVIACKKEEDSLTFWVKSFSVWNRIILGCLCPLTYLTGRIEFGHYPDMGPNTNHMQYCWNCITGRRIWCVLYYLMYIQAEGYPWWEDGLKRQNPPLCCLEENVSCP